MLIAVKAAKPSNIVRLVRMLLQANKRSVALAALVILATLGKAIKIMMRSGLTIQQLFSNISQCLSLQNNSCNKPRSSKELDQEKKPKNATIEYGELPVELQEEEDEITV